MTSRGARIDMSKLTQSLAHKLIRYTPRTNGLRHRVDIDRSELWKEGPVRELTTALRKKGGRNHHGHITVRHRGGGHKRRYRIIDFKRSIRDQPGVVQRLEYDPNRSSYIALVKYPNNQLCYVLLCQGINPGDTILASRTMELEIKPGNAMPLGNIPIGTQVHNIEFLPNKGGQLCRSAGSHAIVVDKVSKPNHVLIQLSSKEKRYFREECLATVGVMSNPLHRLRVLGKAGRSRHLGRRPHVRGKCMNPIDHPMGGGEGSKRVGHLSQSPTGVLAKGYKTRRKPRSKNILTTKFQARESARRG
jgi:large subunit ribosomal protein L2